MGKRTHHREFGLSVVSRRTGAMETMEADLEAPVPEERNILKRSWSTSDGNLDLLEDVIDFTEPQNVSLDCDVSLFFSKFERFFSL